MKRSMKVREASNSQKQPRPAGTHLHRHPEVVPILDLGDLKLHPHGDLWREAPQPGISPPADVSALTDSPCSASPSASGSQAAPPAAAPPPSGCCRRGHRGVLEDKGLRYHSNHTRLRLRGRKHTFFSPSLSDIWIKVDFTSKDLLVLLKEPE